MAAPPEGPRPPSLPSWPWTPRGPGRTHLRARCTQRCCQAARGQQMRDAGNSSPAQCESAHTNLLKVRGEGAPVFQVRLGPDVDMACVHSLGLAIVSSRVSVARQLRTGVNASDGERPQRMVGEVENPVARRTFQDLPLVSLAAARARLPHSLTERSVPSRVQRWMRCSSCEAATCAAPLQRRQRCGNAARGRTTKSPVLEKQARRHGLRVT